MNDYPDNTMACPYCSEEIFYEAERCPYCENYIFEEGAEEIDESDELITCPYCKEEICDESEQCPYCGNYITEEEIHAEPQQPAWILWGTFICILIVLGWILGNAR